MAKYWECLKYHEDKVEKRKLTNDDVEFLKELQKELNTQDTCGTANPRYWVIRDDRFVSCTEGAADTFQVYDSENIEIVATGMEEFYKYLNELIDEEIIDTEYKLVLTDGIWKNQIELHSEDGLEETLEDIYDLKNFVEDVDGISHLKFIPVRKESFTIENEMFLTQTDAEKHLRANYYYYGKEARTYCMSSWRSPRYEQLLKILSEVDFDKVEVQQ